MSIIGNPIMAGASGPAASIFVTGLSETDTVTATNGSKTLNGKWTQKLNPAIHGLPDGYTELEYIESTGTQYVKTGISGITANFSAEIDFQFMSYANDKYIFGYFGMLDGQEWRAGYYRDSLYTGGGFTYSESDPLKRMKATSDKAGTYQTETTCSLFGQYAYNAKNPGYGLCNAKLFSCIIRNNGVPIRDFIPAKRNSDSVIGLYDLVNDVFYTNAGTGTFTAGPVIPQTFDGFLIEKIKDFGTWTVTATDGEQTATQDVLVDVITEYEIEMMCSKLYLYRDGDECEDVTGGWTAKSAGNASFTKDGTRLIAYGGSNSTSYGKFYTVNKVDVTGWNKLKVTIDSATVPSSGGDSSFIGLSETTDISADFGYNVLIANVYIGVAGEYEVDISAKIGSYYICFGSGNANRRATATNIWLE